MRSLNTLYEVKVLNKADLMTLTVYIHNPKSDKFVYWGTSANIKLEKWVKKYVHRIWTSARPLHFSIPIDNNSSKDKRELLYCNKCVLKERRMDFV